MFLQPNLSNTETIEIIKEKIKNKTPFALTRFGDGEIYILNRNGYESFNSRVCREYGYRYPDDVNKFYDDAKKIVQDALIKTDIIGIMDKDCDIIPKGIYNENTWSLNESFISNLGLDVDKLFICDHMIARSKVLGNILEFKKILNGEDLHIISPNKKILELKKLGEILECNVNITEHPFSINFNNRDEFINNFDKIKETVVIYGCGLQKDYGVILRDNYGKIALDMGATMDAWSGIMSRPWFNKNNRQDYLTL
jgi:hypothetical protein